MTHQHYGTSFFMGVYSHSSDTSLTFQALGASYIEIAEEEVQVLYLNAPARTITMAACAWRFCLNFWHKAEYFQNRNVDLSLHWVLNNKKRVKT